MASNEGIGSRFRKQPSGHSSKLRIYESLFLLNEGINHIITLLRKLEKLPLADKKSVQYAVVELEEVRCDMNAEFTEKLADSERLDGGALWKQRRTFEQKWRDPDDVYIDVVRREEERKKVGLPPRIIGSILPHAAVAAAEERWEAEQEWRKKRSGKQRK